MTSRDAPVHFSPVIMLSRIVFSARGYRRCWPVAMRMRDITTASGFRTPSRRNVFLPPSMPMTVKAIDLFKAISASWVRVSRPFLSKQHMDLRLYFKISSRMFKTLPDKLFHVVAPVALSSSPAAISPAKPSHSDLSTASAPDDLDPGGVRVVGLSGGLCCDCDFRSSSCSTS